MLVLVVRNGSEAGRRIEVVGPRLRIGRAWMNDLALPDEDHISSRHGELWLEDDGTWTYRDLGSTNGSAVKRADGRGIDLRGATPDQWAVAMRELVAFQRAAKLEPWVAAGCRDLRAIDWEARFERLFGDYVVGDGALAYALRDLEGLWALPACVLPQDAGPCNLRWCDGRIESLDWSDVVIGPPGMLLDRFLNEVKTEAQREAVTSAWIDAWGPGAAEAWAATRRFALLIEAVRFDDELPWMDADAPFVHWLREANQKQFDRWMAVRTQGSTG